MISIVAHLDLCFLPFPVCFDGDLPIFLLY